MTPSYFNFQPSLLIDLNEDQVIPHDYDQQHHTLKLHHASSSSSSSSSPPPCPFFFSSSQGQAGYHFMGSHGSSNHQEVDNFSTCGEGSLRCHRVEETKMECNGLKFSIRKKEEHSENGSASVKWMSSKMRLMKTTTIKPKQMNGAKTSMIGENTFKYYEDHKQPSSSPMDISSSNNNNSATIRVCADCNTTKTPLWRSGPRGPKSLCNACGIRQRKARRAMAAAASGTILGTKTPTMKSSSKVQHEEIKRSSTGFGLQQKKRTKATSNPSRNQKKLCFEEFALNLTKKLSLIHQVFPQEEKEAAILLMALSYGLVHG